MLQEKLNAYLSFVESDEILESYPDAKDGGINYIFLGDKLIAK
ncbi:MAG: hypothetical protein ACI8WB_002342 [Phenylobacterium sp.]|jgi:hypothetical protein